MDMDVETCPKCPPASSTASFDTWLQCDACNVWYHAACLGLSSNDCEQIELYHCPTCVDEHGPSTYKPKQRKSKREHTRLNYADLNEGKTADQAIWTKILRAKAFAQDPFQRYRGGEVTQTLLRETGLREPIVIEHPDGLGMTMPSSSMTVQDIADAVGREHPVEVIDVATQSEVPGWTMGRWADYYSTPAEERDRIRNVISLEISNTKFAENIVRPNIVREVDWIDQIWPKELKPVEYPKVQLYCLMGTEGSYTDFHIDFGGSSVFYHVFRGSKVFYFIEPTSKNLRKYQKWSSSPDQSTIFFGDEVKKCYAVHLRAGNTMIIPTGWIHAVYTPEDALVIGGNFLHSMNIGTQIRIHDIEAATDVPQKFRFPYYKRINWYAAAYYRDALMHPQAESVSTFELGGLASLAQWLRADVAKYLGEVETTPDVQKQIRHDIPSSISDPRSLLTELISGVEKVVAKRLATEREPTSTESDSKQPSASDSPKVKLKLLPATNEKKRKKDQSRTPKIVLKVSSTPHQLEEEVVAKESIRDDDYYEMSHGEELSEEDILGDELEMDSSDEEYQSEDEDLRLSASIPMHRQRSKPRANIRRKLKQESEPEESSSDDDLGTSSTKANKKQRLITPAAKPATGRNGKKTTTVKQRLLERVIRTRR